MLSEGKLEAGSMYMTRRSLACIQAFPTKEAPDFIYATGLPENSYFVFLEEICTKRFDSIHGSIPKSTYSKILVGKDIVYTYKVKKLLTFLEPCVKGFP